MMTGKAAPRVPKNNRSEKGAGKNGNRSSTALNAVAEYSLSGFLHQEPEIYSVSDLAIRNPATLNAIEKSDRDITQGRVKTISSVDDLLNERV